jgi:chromosome segregation ATPase
MTFYLTPIHRGHNQIKPPGRVPIHFSKSSIDMGDDDEVSDEEFLQVTTQNLSIGAEIDELKTRLRDFAKKWPDIDDQIQSSEEELRKVESAREFARATREQSLVAFRADLNELRQEVEEEAKREHARVTELASQISLLTQKIQDYDQQIDNLKEKLKADDVIIQRKTLKFQSMVLREQPFRPYVEFLRVSRSLPMYIEDLGSRIATLRVNRARVDTSVRELTAQISELRRTHASIKAQLKSKQQDFAAIQAQAIATNERLVNAGKEIETTQKSVSEANHRLELVKEQTQALLSEQSLLESQLTEMRARFAEELAGVERSRAEIEASLNDIQSAKDQELNACNDRIQAIRTRLTHIKEKDEDPEIPRVDVDLRRQIERVQAEKAEIVSDTQRVADEGKRLEVQLQQRTWDLQTLALKTQPTQAILAMPEFQQKFVLLTELVLQNMGLREAVTRMTGRILALKQENGAIRKRLEGQA